jgi:hypothetical protein
MQKKLRGLSPQANYTDRKYVLIKNNINNY